MKQEAKSPNKINRRKLLGLSIAATASVGLTKFSFFSSNTRKIASNSIGFINNNQNINIKNLKFVKVKELTESTKLSRFLVRLSSYEFRKKYYGLSKLEK